MVFLFSPFVAELIYVSINHEMLADWSSLLVFPHSSEIHWGLFISTLVWSNGGYDLIGMPIIIDSTYIFILINLAFS